MLDGQRSADYQAKKLNSPSVLALLPLRSRDTAATPLGPGTFD